MNTKKPSDISPRSSQVKKTIGPRASIEGRSAYGTDKPICINTDCTLRKKAGGCFGFEGCPGFKAR